MSLCRKNNFKKSERKESWISIKKALVTGATGFIGQKLVNELLRKNIAVVAVSRQIKYSKQKNYHSICLDITIEEDFTKLPKDFDVIFHTAAFLPPDNSKNYKEEIFNTNVKGTSNLIKFATLNKIRTFIFSSSIAVYGLITKGAIDESYPANPKSLYGISKKGAEEIVLSSSKSLIPVVLRYPSVYGPGMKLNTVIPLFVKKVKNNEDIIIWGSGKRTQDFVYVDDVVRANIKSWESDVSGVYLIGSGIQISLIELTKTVKSLFPTSTSKIVIDSFKIDDKQRVCFDYKKAKKDFNYAPTYTLKQGLREFKNHL